MVSPGQNCLFSTLLKAATVCCVLAAPATARADDLPPDLVALSIQGPGQALVGAVTTVNILVVNLGGPFAGEYSLEVLLSLDETIGPEDPVIASHSTALVGSLTLKAEVPASLTPDVYRWAARIQPLAGETVTFNNEILGGLTEIYVVDLSLLTPNAISVNAVAGGENPEPYIVLVENAGSANGILVFTVTEDPEVPWLSVTPTASFDLAGGAPQAISLFFRTDGLAIGAYSTSLVFQNYGDQNDFEVVTVNLTVGSTTIEPGDLIVGQISDSADVDEAAFVGVEGMKLKLCVSCQTGNVRPRVSVLTDQHQVVKSWTFKHSAKSIKKSVKLPHSGQFLLRIEGEGDSVGSYVVKTKRSLPSKAKSFKTKVKPDKGTATSEVELLALPVANLELAVKPRDGFTGPLALTFTRPGGQVLDINSYSATLAGGGVKVTGVPLDEVGAYRIGIAGYGGNKEKVKVTVGLTQGGLGGATVLLP